MRTRNARRRLTAAVAGAAAAAAFLAPGASPAAALTAMPAGSCAWYANLNTSGVNALALDANVTYWVTRVPYVPGESLTLRGQYPHARYMSVTAYDPRARAVSSLYDAQIQPDPGSTNPFAAGADRAAPQRSYTLSVRFLNPGEQPSAAPNVLSTGFAPGTTAPASDFFLVYRVYLPDSGARRDGSVGLPATAVNLPGAGATPIPACPAGYDPGPQANDAVAAAGLPAATPADATASAPAWHRFYNAPTTAAGSPDSTGKTSFAGTASPATMATGSGGYLEDLENAYLYAFANLGAAPVVVIQAQALGYSDTSSGSGRMPDQRAVRYWSLCTYDAPTQRNLGCASDHQLAAQGGAYTVVISTPANRPPDLCGATWLPFGPGPQALLVFRNQLGIAPGTVQQVSLGHEREMGAYYPAASYTDQAGYSVNVCHQAPGAGSGGPLGGLGGPLGGTAAPAPPGGSPGAGPGGTQAGGPGYQPDNPVVGNLGAFGDFFGGLDLDLGAPSALDLGAASDLPDDAGAGTGADGLDSVGTSEDEGAGAVKARFALAAAAPRGNQPLGLALAALLLGTLGVTVRRRLTVSQT